MIDRHSEILNPALSVADLLLKIEEGWRPIYLPFWGHSANADSPAGKHVLSQWWPCAFIIEDIRYPSAEHYMMAEKARLFDNHDVAERILKAASPGAAKALGRQVRGFTPETWEAHRFDIVVRANIAKFGQNLDLRLYLLNTGPQVLVEASPVDAIWGIGMAKDDPNLEKPELWKGLNLLGFALMKARAVFQAEQNNV